MTGRYKVTAASATPAHAQLATPSAGRPPPLHCVLRELRRRRRRRGGEGCPAPPAGSKGCWCKLPLGLLRCRPLLRLRRLRVRLRLLRRRLPLLLRLLRLLLRGGGGLRGVGLRRSGRVKLWLRLRQRHGVHDNGGVAIGGAAIGSGLLCGVCSVCGSAVRVRKRQAK
jgi:hypothetical protein